MDRQHVESRRGLRRDGPGEGWGMSGFKAPWKQTMEELETTFAKWGIREWQVRPMRELDHRYHGSVDPAKVTVEYVLNGDRVSLDCAAHGYYYENLRVLYLAIEAMRMNEVRGLTNVIRDAYMQLVAPKSKRDPWEVLGLRPDAGAVAVDAVYRALAKERHPDAGGSDEAMRELNEAYEAVKAR